MFYVTENRRELDEAGLYKHRYIKIKDKNGFTLVEFTNPIKFLLFVDILIRKNIYEFSVRQNVVYNMDSNKYDRVMYDDEFLKKNYPEILSIIKEEI